jgi:TfoX/Sxy family transcriptional regulator of competence genes
MPYDEKLAQRIRHELGRLPNLEEKRMFGGVGFLVKGNMACGVHKNLMIIRVGPHGFRQALTRPYTKVFDMTGKPMAGWITVEAPGFQADEDLKSWVKLGVEYALTLPPKSK